MTNTETKVEDFTNITGLRLISGEFIIAKLVDVGAMLVIEDPMMIQLYQTESGVSAQMSPACPFSKDGVVSMPSNAIAMMFEPTDQASGSYKSAILRMKTGIVVPEEKKIVLTK